MKKIIACLTIGILVLLSGCGEAQEKMKESQETIIGSAGQLNVTDNNHSEEIIQKEINDYLSCDANVIIPEDNNGEATVYKISLKEFDQELLIKAFEINEADVISNGGQSYRTDNSYLSWGRLLRYSTDLGENMRNLMNPAWCKNDSNLNFISSENAEQDLLNFVYNKLEFAGDLRISNRYVIDEYTETKLNELMSGESDLKTGELIGEIDYLEGQEGAYYFTVSKYVDGIEMFDTDVEEDGIILPSFKIECLYTINGIEAFDSKQEIIIGDSVGKVNLLSPEDVLVKLEEKFDNIILSTHYTVTHIKLIYRATKDSTIIPVWEIHLTNDENMETKVWFDAESGKEIL